MDRRSSINYINEKYHGRRSTSFVAPAVAYNQVSAPIYAHEHVTQTPVVHVEEPIVDVPVSQPAPIHDTRIHSKGFRICGCPWWLCLLLSLLGLLLLGVLIGFLTGVFGEKRVVDGTTTVTTEEPATTEGVQTSGGAVNGGTPEQGCNPGFFPHNGKCISCPEGSRWNGENCVKITSHLERRSF